MTYKMDGVASSDPALPPAIQVDTPLRAALAREDRALSGTLPVLRHLIGRDDQAVFADDIVARVRGMADDVAMQLIAAVDAADGDGQAPPPEDLATAIAADQAVLAHIHALALEGRLAAGLQESAQLDPVLSPLIQALVGSSEPETAALAMKVLAAQARFGSAQRRMKLPIAELPGDLLHSVLVALRNCEGIGSRGARAEETIRAGFDEGASRLGLIGRLVADMRGGAIAALALDHAGAAIFFTALAGATGGCRDAILLSACDDHVTRLVVTLSAAGLKPRAIEEQFLLLHPDKSLPVGGLPLDPAEARAILADAGRPA